MRTRCGDLRAQHLFGHVDTGGFWSRGGTGEGSVEGGTGGKEFCLGDVCVVCVNVLYVFYGTILDLN